MRLRMYKKAGTKRCMVLLALALVFNFISTKKFINWSNKAQAFKAHQLWHFLF